MKLVFIAGAAIAAVGVAVTRIAKDPPTANLGMLAAILGVLVAGGAIAAALL